MDSNEHEDFMKKAILLSRRGREEGAPFGAIIVKEGELISSAYNEAKNLNDCTAHAEVLAIRRACALLGSRSLKGCILYTSCEPCMMCLGSCYWAGLDAIYFGCSAEDAKENGFVYSNMYFNTNAEDRSDEFKMQQLLRDEALNVWESN